MNREHLTRLFQSQDGLPERSKFCPEDGELASWYDGLAKSHRAARVRRHVAECDYCQARTGLLARLEQSSAENLVSEELLAAAKLKAIVPIARRKALAPTWAAAILVLATALVTGFLFLAESPNDAAILKNDGYRELRGLDASPTKLTLLSPRDGEQVGPGELRIHWTPVEDVLFYTLLVTDDAGTPLMEQRLKTNHWELVLDGLLEPGSDYFIQVEARLPDARSLLTDHVFFTLDEGG